MADPSYTRPGVALHALGTQPGQAVPASAAPVATSPPKSGLGVPEKIILCVDVTEEMGGMEFAVRGAERSRLQFLKQALIGFVVAKLHMSSKHEIALCIATEEAEWLADFTSDADALVRLILNLAPRTINFPSFDISSLFAQVEAHAPLPEVDAETGAPPHVVRAVLFYGRSAAKPSYTMFPDLVPSMMDNPAFFFDALYLHQKPSATADPQGVFDALTAIDTRGTDSYFLEDSKNLRRMILHVTMLLAHPLQRTDCAALEPSL